MNKVKYGLKNVYAAPMTETVNNGVVTYSYATPKAIPGAVNMSLNAEGESNPFYADNIVYFRSTTNNGYSGDLEMAMVPEWFREEILQEIKDSNGVFVERSDVGEPVHFALLFQFEGDQKAIRHVLYNCSVSARPAVASQTKEAGVTPVTETMSLSADPRADGVVKARSGSDTNSTVYQNWFNAVYEAAGSEETVAKLSALSIGSLDLTPAFNAGTYIYSAETTNATNAVTATGADGTTVTITINGTAHTSGQAATWTDGENLVVVTVSGSGLQSTVYTVVVTKSA